MSQIFPVDVFGIGNATDFEAGSVEVQKIKIPVCFLQDKFAVMLVLEGNESLAYEVGDIE